MKTCAQCDTPISRHNRVSGLCAEHRVAKLPHCTECGKPLTYGNLSGLCAKHYGIAQGYASPEIKQKAIAMLLEGKRSADVARALGISPNVVQKLSKDNTWNMPTRRLASIIAAACAYSGLTRQELESAAKPRHIVIVRHAICMVAMDAGHSSPAVGRALGGRDHTTVLHGREAGRQRAIQDPEFARFVADVASGEMPEAFESETQPAATLQDAPIIKSRPSFVPIPPDVLERALKSYARPRNVFEPDADADSSHEFHKQIAHGSRSLLSAIQTARAA